MKQIYIILYSLLICLVSMEPLLAIASNDKQEANNLRILNLLPNLLVPLAVEPCLPADFVALTPSGILDPYDWIYWGPEETLKAYFKDPETLKVPLIRVKLSANTVQKGSDSFDKSSMEFLKVAEEKAPGATSKFQWGDYPVISVNTKVQNQIVFMAWVGLNDPEAGWTLLFNFMYPQQKDHPPTVKDLQLWTNLLSKTVALKDGDYFKAQGQDLQDGFTLVNVCGAKLKMIAEKRERDGMIQVAVIPQDSTVEFHYVDMEECLMGAEWRYREPLVKVYGEIVSHKYNCIEGYVTSIFFKQVKEFSLKKDDDKKTLIFQKICEDEEE